MSDSPQLPTVSLVDHDPAWAVEGARLAGLLRARLGPLALRVEHIGSTAIAGMAAKDVLDLQLSVADLAAAQEAFTGPLRELGFTLHHYRQDHVPAGRDDGPADWRKRLWHRRDHPEGAANLHARLAGSPGERLALLFRDWFRAHPGQVPAYSRFKRTVAQHVPDIGAYTDIKDPVVDLIVAQAEHWAAETGWTPPTTDPGRG
jgi:GrpB-like predicted nucleotidyltransferase (UPF0157 family)